MNKSNFSLSDDSTLRALTTQLLNNRRLAGMTSPLRILLFILLASGLSASCVSPNERSPSLFSMDPVGSGAPPLEMSSPDSIKQFLAWIEKSDAFLVYTDPETGSRVSLKDKGVKIEDYGPGIAPYTLNARFLLRERAVYSGWLSLNQLVDLGLKISSDELIVVRMKGQLYELHPRYRWEIGPLDDLVHIKRIPEVVVLCDDVNRITIEASRINGAAKTPDVDQAPGTLDAHMSDVLTKEFRERFKAAMFVRWSPEIPTGILWRLRDISVPFMETRIDDDRYVFAPSRDSAYDDKLYYSIVEKDSSSGRIKISCRGQVQYLPKQGYICIGPDYALVYRALVTAATGIDSPNSSSNRPDDKTVADEPLEMKWDILRINPKLRGGLPLTIGFLDPFGGGKK